MGRLGAARLHHPSPAVAERGGGLGVDHLDIADLTPGGEVEPHQRPSLDAALTEGGREKVGPPTGLEACANVVRTILQRVVGTFRHVRRRQAVASTIEVRHASPQRRSALDDGFGYGASGLCIQGSIAGRAQGLDIDGAAISVHAPAHNGPGSTAGRRSLSDPVVREADGKGRPTAPTFTAAVGLWAGQSIRDGITDRTPRSRDGEVAQQIVPIGFR